MMETFYKPYDGKHKVVFCPNDNVEFHRKGGFAITVNGKLIISGKAFGESGMATQYPVGLTVQKDDKVIVTVGFSRYNEKKEIKPGETELITTANNFVYILVSVALSEKEE